MVDPTGMIPPYPLLSLVLYKTFGPTFPGTVGPRRICYFDGATNWIPKKHTMSQWYNEHWNNKVRADCKRAKLGSTKFSPSPAFIRAQIQPTGPWIRSMSWQVSGLLQQSKTARPGYWAAPNTQFTNSIELTESTHVGKSTANISLPGGKLYFQKKKNEKLYLAMVYGWTS